MSAAPSSVSIASDRGYQVDRPKVAVAPPNMTTAASIFTPTFVLSGRKEKKMAVSVAPTAGAARSGPKPVGTDMKDVAGINRKHGRHAAEQDGEQVQRLGARQAIAPDISEAVRHLLQRTSRLQFPGRGIGRLW